MAIAVALSSFCQNHSADSLHFLLDYKLHLHIEDVTTVVVKNILYSFG